MGEECDAPASNHPTMTSSARLGALLLAAVVLIPACGDDDASSATSPSDATDRTTTTTTAGDDTTTSTDPDAGVEAEVEQAYYDQWDAFVEIFADPNPSNPLIDEHFTGEQREKLLDAIAVDVKEGVVLERPTDPELFEPQVRSVEMTSDSRAILIGCLVDGLIVRHRASGAVLNDDVVTLESEHEFSLVDGKWKLERTKTLSEVDGVGGCAE